MDFSTLIRSIGHDKPNNQSADLELLTHLTNSPTITQHISSELLNHLALLLINPAYTHTIIQECRPLLIELVARCMELFVDKKEVPESIKGCMNRHNANWWPTQWFKTLIEDAAVIEDGVDVTCVELMVGMFSITLPNLPQIQPFAVHYLQVNQEALNTLLISLSPSTNVHRKRFLMRAIYRLCFLSKETFIQFFKWDTMNVFLSDADIYTLAYSVHALSFIAQMSDADRRLFVEKYVPLSMIDLAFDVTSLSSTEHLTLIPYIELQVNGNQQLQMFSQSPETTLKMDHCDLIININGILLPNINALSGIRTRPTSSNFVLTRTVEENLGHLAQSVALQLPVLLEGSSSSGKTSLVDHLASRIAKNELLKIHLGDQTDSKILLGTYISTDEPGIFKWQPGILTTAVTQGRWLLIEDIDLAPHEVLSILIPLLETRTLFIASRGEQIRASEHFRLFATRTTNSAYTTSKSTLESLWHRIEVREIPQIEVLEMLKARFPGIGSLERVVDVYASIKEHSETQKGFSRKIGLRDVLKWCQRISKIGALSDAQVMEDILREAHDVFLGYIADDLFRRTCFLSFGTLLGIQEHRCEFFHDAFVPLITETSSNSVTIGRATLQNANVPTNSFFALTNHALKLLERLSVSVTLNERVLLIGETGTGKTSAVQYLAKLMNKRLDVFNMSQQSESSDLLGGFKPMDSLTIARLLVDEFVRLFSSTFNAKKNAAFLQTINKAFLKRKWKHLFVGFRSAIGMAREVERNASSPVATPNASDDESDVPVKKVKLLHTITKLIPEWLKFEQKIKTSEVQMEKMDSSLFFTFVEGSFVQAVRNGDWILLDEINLASAETLECLSGLLQEGDASSLLLFERGDTEPIKPHPDFRLFGCMNPATDTGKHDLPPGLRSRFTEYYVDSPDKDLKDLELIIRQYLFAFLPPAHEGNAIVNDVAKFYTRVKELAVSTTEVIVDGANRPVHYSTRTLSRALSYATSIVMTYGLRRSIYEGLIMTFATQLDAPSRASMITCLQSFLLSTERNINAFLKQTPKEPTLNLRDEFVLFGSFWVRCGELSAVSKESLDDYVITPSVNEKLNDLARAVMAAKYPVLIQGPTSAGKTSMIEYLAKRTGNRFVRINNHEHTDLQEYIGSYVPDSNGHLVFKEGILVEALRKGYWIVLDELNLAPSDVLEAMNRLLDDNRELLIPETQEIVKPHRNFLLFATQNPPGLYGGRKVLSRAFRNRFLELHFNDLPETELQGILYQRCKIAPSYAKKIVEVYLALRLARQRSRIFDGKHGFITLRDLFRWSNRQAETYQLLAEDGYMILGERTRTLEDSAVVQRCLEEVMRVKIDVEAMYNRRFLEVHSAWGLPVTESTLVWTKAMKRLYSLIATCILHNEPVLLIGSTGCGKTSVCQLIAAQLEQVLHIVNVHQNSETADFLGSQRPARNHSIDDEGMDAIYLELLSLSDQTDLDYTIENITTLCASLKDTQLEPAHTEKLHTLTRVVQKSKQLFEWADGPLVKAMKNGDLFLLDEISLADDSVLERLNSVLEPQRLLVLAEKLEEAGGSVQEITAVKAFQFMATMNPGGDYGKKELSPALRNRFTEIWVPQIDDRDDVLDIMNSSVSDHLRAWNTSEKIYAYLVWIAAYLNTSYSKLFSVRDLLAWAHFMNVTASDLTIEEAFYHAGCMVIVDGIGANPLLTSTTASSAQLKMAFEAKLREMTRLTDILDTVHLSTLELISSHSRCGIAGFSLATGSHDIPAETFNLSAPTTKLNTLRIFRSLQITKPILLEGDPGVGKTSLVSKLASLSGHKLTRINLSEQTDLMDLFGSDLPVESDGDSPRFAWRDGPFLQAMTNGYWVLLDELNLASQQVLEGLNACLDHRGSVYIPELDRTFVKSPLFRIFAAQNPQEQGGGRKGLPASFLNRFTKVYIDAMTEDDLVMISQALHPHVNVQVIKRMVQFTSRLQQCVSLKKTFGRDGSPWEFNIRDTTRWISLLDRYAGSKPSDHVEMIFSLRMRSEADRDALRALYLDVFGESTNTDSPSYRVSTDKLIIGKACLPRVSTISSAPHTKDLSYLVGNGIYFESVAECIDMGWMTLLYGPSGCGKTSLIRYLASITGNELVEFSMNEGIDTLEILGGFEQIDVNRKIEAMKKLLSVFVLENIQNGLLGKNALQIESIVEVSSIVGSLNASSLLECRRILTNLQQRVQNNTLDTALISINQIIKESSRSSQGQFESIDSQLVKALQQGQWIMLDHANLCSPSVLDRLNSLFEPNGSIIMNERGVLDGEIITIKPHVNFRLFMTLDPTRGEISRAMRNRGIEIYMLDAAIKHFEANECVLWAQRTLDVYAKSGVLSDEDVSVEKCLLRMDSIQRGSVDDALRVPAVICGAFPVSTSAIDQSYSYLNLPIKFMESLAAASSTDFAGLFDIISVESTFVDYRLLLVGLKSLLLSKAVDESTILTRLAIIKKLNETDFQSMPVAFRLNAFRLIVTQSMVECSICNIEQSSLISLSAQFDQGNLFASQLSHPVIKLIHPFYQTLHTFNAQNMESGDCIRTEEQLVHIITGESVDLFPLWMILEDLKASSFVALHADSLEEMKLALDIENTALFKDAWKMWSPCVVQTESDHLISQDILDLSKRFEVNFSSFKELMSSIERKTEIELQDLLCDLGQMIRFEDVTSDPTIMQDSLVRIRKAVTVVQDATDLPTDPTNMNIDDTFARRKQACMNLIALLAVNLKEPVMLRDVMQWTITQSIPGHLYKSLLTSTMPLRVAHSFRKHSLDALGSIKSWLEMVWEGQVGVTQDISRTSVIQKLLNGSADIDITDIKSKALLSGPRYLYRAATLPTIHQMHHIFEKCSIEQYLFVKDWIGQITPPLLAIDTSDSTLVSSFSSTLYLTLLKALLTILGSELNFDLLGSFESLDSNFEEIKKDLETLAASYDLTYLVASLVEIRQCFTSVWIQSVGKSFTYLGFSLLKVIFKSRLIDPVEEQNARYIETLDDIQSTQVYCNQLLSMRILSGEVDYASARTLNAKIKLQKTLLTELESTRGFRPSNASIRQLSDEIHQFLEGPLNESIIASISEHASDIDSKESLFQHNIIEYFSRMSTKHSHFNDILAPFSQITNLIRSGVRMMIDGRASVAHVYTPLFNLLDARIATLDDLELEGKTKTERVSLLCSLLDEQIEMNVTISDTANNILLSIFTMWSDNEEKLAADEASSTTLYRFKAEEESDDRFVPDVYSEIESALLDQFDMSLDAKDAPKVVDTTTVDYNALAFTMRNYQRAVIRNNTTHHASFALRWDGIKSDLAKLTSPTKAFDKNIKFLLLTRLTTFLDTTTTAHTDFYNDANMPESTRILPLLEEMDSQLTSILLEWSENFMLIQLQKLVQTIARMPLKSPVIKFLSAAEILLLKCEEWEAYASSKVSLKAHMAKLIELIISWRKLELNSWSKLLDNENVKFERSAARLWFHLYKILILGSTNEITVEHVDIVREVLGNYILSSKLGEFAYRLETLTLFADHLDLNSQLKPSQSNQIIDLIRNFVHYYSQFNAFCVKKIASHYKQSSKQIQEFAKIASWKDVNVYALKNTALKSHRQLNKYIRLYHQELSAPIRDILRLISETVKNARAATAVPVLLLDLQSSLFSVYKVNAVGHSILDDLVKYSERCKSLHRKFNVSTLTKIAASTNELSVDIFDYLLQFQAENREIEAGNAPRGFKTRRRKALSDLFKELGILRPTTRRSVNDLLNLESHAVLNIESTALKSLHQKSESYHFKTINASSEIEGNVAPPHVDLSRRDCDLMTTTRHHILELTSNQRTAIQNISKHQAAITLFSEGLLTNPTETVVVCKVKWNSVVTDIEACVAEFKFLFSRTSAVFGKCPFEFKDVETVLQACLSDLSHHASCLYLIKSTIGFAFITEQQKSAVKEFIEQAAECRRRLDDFLIETPRMNYILEGFVKVLALRFESLTLSLVTLFDEATQEAAHSTHQAGNIVTQMLLVIQHFNGVLETSPDDDVMLSKVLPTIDLSCLERVEKMIQAFNPAPPTTTFEIEATKELFETLVKFTSDYKLILNQVWHQTIISSKSCYKLSYILLNLYRFLHKNGYKIPEGHEENEEEEGEAADGMGLADGTAENMAQDDIDDIDFEDGLTPDTNAPNEPGEDQNEGMDVEHDFDSKLEDVPNPRTGEDEKDGSGSESDSGSLDEEMGDLDQKGEVLDEKLWDEKDEKDDREEKLEDDNGIESKGQDTEVVGNDSPDQNEKKEAQEEDEKEQSEFQETTDAKFEETQIEENHRQEVKEDEMQLQDNPQQDESMSEDEGADASGDESDNQDIQDIEQPKPSAEQAEEAEQMKPSETNDPNDVEPDSTPEEESKDEIDLDGLKGDRVSEDEAMQSEDENADESEKKDEQTLEEETGLPDTIEDDSQQELNDNANGTGSVEDPEQVKESESVESESKANDDNQLGSAEEMGDGDGVGQASSEQQKLSKESKKDKAEDKPITPATTLAEMEKKMKTWLQALEETSETPEEAAPNGESIVNAMDTEETDDIVMDTNNSKSKIDEIEKSDQRKIVNETEEESTTNQYDMDVDMPLNDTEDAEEQALPELSVSVEKRLVNEFNETPEASENIQSMSRTFDDSEFLDDDAIMDEAIEQAASDLITDNEARETWRRFGQLTEGLSFTLCEQLRLILEPTLTAKYRGDYRTGKRLNMRKIIPYIASHFKKDKIWLRRSKPSKRTYQIMMSIDDSKSMRDSGCTDIAIQSLVLITKSLQLLEAGELAVVGFGEHSNVIHDFGAQLNEEAGMSIIKNLTFNQDKTRVKEMLHHAFEVLETARQNSRTKDVWQLQLILSDGICDDHKSVTSLVTLAAEKRIMTVFIVLDTRRERDSIAKMATVSYTTDKDGESVLKMEKYMDTFPFEYYIILRDISGLPQVLAETLRQYFSFVNKD